MFIIHDPVMTLTNHILQRAVKKTSRNGQMDRIFLILKKKIDLMDYSDPPLELYVYIHVSEHYSLTN